MSTSKTLLPLSILQVQAVSIKSPCGEKLLPYFSLPVTFYLVLWNCLHKDKHV